MKTIKLQKNNITKNQLAEIADYFLNGKVVAYPTDTIYGLGCLAENQKAVERVSKIKRRFGAKGYVVLMKSFCMVHDYCFVSKKQDRYLRTLWAPKSADLAHLEGLPNKKAITVILKSRGFLKETESKEGKIAVRIPKDRFLLDLLKKINKPIVSTSLNISGQPTLNTLDGLGDYFGQYSPDLAVDNGKIKNKKASQLLDIADIDNIRIIRK